MLKKTCMYINTRCFVLITHIPPSIEFKSMCSSWIVLQNHLLENTKAKRVKVHHRAAMRPNWREKGLWQTYCCNSIHRYLVRSPQGPTDSSCAPVLDGIEIECLRRATEKRDPGRLGARGPPAAPGAAVRSVIALCYREESGFTTDISMLKWPL